MSFVTDIILSFLISRELPHNVVFSVKGQKVIIIPRKFIEGNGLGFNSTWLDLSGMITIHSDKLLKEINLKGRKALDLLVQKEISIDKNLFAELSGEIVNKFKNQFIIN